MPSHPPSALEARTLLTGLVIGESPRWHEGRLWFANWGTEEIVAVDPAGTAEVVAQGVPEPQPPAEQAPPADSGGAAPPQ